MSGWGVREERVGKGEHALFDVLHSEQADTSVDLAALLENGSLGLHWVSSDGTILWANSPDYEALGYAREEFVGHNIREFHNDPAIVSEMIRRLATGEVVKNFPAQLRSKGGRIRHVLVTAHAHIDPSGSVMRARCLTRDVTEHVHAERRLRSTLMAIADPVLVLGRDWHVSLVNPRAVELFGKAADELSNNIFWDAFPEIMGTDVARALREAMDLGTPTRATAFFASTGRSYEAVTTPLDDGVLVVLRDVSGPRRTAAEAEDSKERRSVVTEQAPIGIVCSSPDGMLTDVNPAFCAMLGYARDELVGRNVYDLTHPHDRSLDQAKAAQVLAGQENSYTIQKRFIRKDGTEVWVKLVACAVRDGTGAIPFAIGIVENIDRRRRDGEARRKSEERLQLLGRLAPVGMLQTDPNCRCLYVNEEWARIAGRAPAEALGEGWIRAIHPEDRERVLSELRASVRLGRSFRAEYRFLRPDGVCVWVLGSLVETRSSGGERIFLMAVTDITDRIEAESARHRLATIVDSSPDAICLGDLDATIATWNKSAERIFGYTAKEALGRPLASLVDESAASELTQMFYRARTGGVLRNVEFTGRRKDGKRIDIAVSLLSLSSLKQPRNDTANVAAIFRDISEQKEQEHELVRRATIIERLNDCVISMDMKGIVRSWNRGAERMWGWSAEEAIGRDISFLYDGEDLRFLQENVVGELARKGEHRLQIRGATRSGEERWVELSLSVIFDANGEPEGLVGITADMTQRRRAEMDREAMLTDLQRTLNFYNLFVGVLSHDLRNPLGAIMTAADLLSRRKDDDDREHRIVQRIRSSGGRMLRMIEQLLDVTRIRAGNGLLLEKEEVKLDEICEQVKDELDAAHPGFKLDIVSRGDVSGVWDPDRLAQVASNLLGNAIQHSSGSRTVRVIVDGTSPELVRLSVQNRGVIAPELLPAIFDPFRRAEHASKKTSGLGLGLYITRQIAVAHGGDVYVTSSAHEGTTFILDLPRVALPSNDSPFSSRPGIGETSFVRGQ